MVLIWSLPGRGKTARKSLITPAFSGHTGYPDRRQLFAQSKMASKLSDHVCAKICNLKLDLLCNAKQSDEKTTISRYFRDLSVHAERLEALHDRSNLYSSAECFVNTRPMIARLLNKIHCKIMRRLHPKPNICNPWHGEFSHDVPMEVWNILLTGVICHNSFGHELLSSPSGILTNVKIFDIWKARYIFDWQNMDGVIIPNKQLLKKNYSQHVKEGEVQERTEVIVSVESPLVFKWNRNSEVLQVTFRYGHWDEYGIPIH